MPDGVQLDPDKLQVLDAALHFAFISIAISVWSRAGYAEEASWMLGAQVGNAVVRVGSHRSPGIGLYDGGVHLAFLHSPEHILFRAEQAENATFPQVRVGINPLGHESSRGCRCLPAKRPL